MTFAELATTAVDQLVDEARARLRRVDPHGAVMALDQGAVLVDVRTSEQRLRDGEIPGAVPISLNVLEWRAAALPVLPPGT